MDRYKTALEQCWEIATDNSITEDNKVKIIRDVSRATLDGEPTTADEYNESQEKEPKPCDECGYYEDSVACHYEDCSKVDGEPTTADEYNEC